MNKIVCVTFDCVIFIMILRGGVQKVLHALLEKEWSYWKDHKQERIKLSGSSRSVGWVSLAICTMFSASSVVVGLKKSYKRNR